VAVEMKCVRLGLCLSRAGATALAAGARRLVRKRAFDWPDDLAVAIAENEVGDRTAAGEALQGERGRARPRRVVRDTLVAAGREAAETFEMGAHGHLGLDICSRV
jgi:hypothetical protein